MKATELLMQEHRLIERVLDVLESMADGISRGEPFDAQQGSDILTFLREFADRCHHGKEENHLFAMMGRRGLGPEAGPVAVMLHEHEQGRGHIREMLAAVTDPGTEGASRCFADAARSYTSLLRQHIDKEDNILYRIADDVLTVDDQKALDEAFVQVDRVEIGAQKIAKLRDLAERLVGDSGA